MTRGSRMTIHKGAAAGIAVILFATGAATTYVLVRRSSPGGVSNTTITPPASSPRSAPADGDPTAQAVPLPDVVVSLVPEAVERAGIVVKPVAGSPSAGAIRLPGRVEANAYRQVAATSLVSGRITRVSAELGATVRRGQSLAQIYSPQLSETQTKYVSAKAALDAHDRELQRTQKLVDIGAASRQELERIHAEHAAQTAAVQSARAELELLGATGDAIDALTGGRREATATVAAPIDGTVTERLANVGLNVDPATRLFTVVDLSTVWIVADVYEKDFSRVRVGAETTITTPAYPGLLLRARVSYIDPQLSSETRTARLRVEVPNRSGELRLGMYADVVVAGAGEETRPTIPRSAIQNVGNRTVVYLVDAKAPATFVEREVHIGETLDDDVAVLTGIGVGDMVVTEGSFFVRAERERQGLRPGVAAGRGSNEEVRTAEVVVNQQGFQPATLTLRSGTPARIVFLRTTDNTCATEVVFPSLGIKRALPLNEPVVVELTPPRSGEIAFACGMNMFKGVVVVQ